MSDVGSSRCHRDSGGSFVDGSTSSSSNAPSPPSVASRDEAAALRSDDRSPSCPPDGGGGNAHFMTSANVAQMASQYEAVRGRIQNSWHEQAWRGFTNDPNRLDHQSTEFGWSTMPGGSAKQCAAQARGEPWRLNAWEDDEGKRFYEDNIEINLPAWFDATAQTKPFLPPLILASSRPAGGLG